jgi:hypothetical protein
MRRAWSISIFAFLCLCPAGALASPPSSAAHPRVWITPNTLAAMKGKVADSSSRAAVVPAECAKITSKESELVQAGIQGYNWAYSLGTCALAWRLTGAAAHANTAVRIYRALLDDYVTMGDGAGGDDVVTHDTGYGMRFFGAYAALAYDWLHDAPGVDETLRAHARARFGAWTTWYDTQGYLNHTPGSNYHAGYVFAKTIMAVAVAGEDGARADGYWSDVTDRLFKTDIVQKGLGAGGVLAGGDWPEGWQYGPNSVMEYALAARALADYGTTFPEVNAWADDLTTRFVYGLNPRQDGLYVAGDLDDNVNFDAPLNGRTLVATLAGPGNAQIGAAETLRRTANTDLCPAFDALAEARNATPSDPRAGRPLFYLAKGTRNVYARTSWKQDATFAVFTSAPRLVPDHQHADASNFILYRGGDRLIVDPSPYGSRSSLTGNAISADSNAVPDSYRPSQSPYAHAELPWARATASGVVAARAEIADAFGNDTEATDVPFARRDWAFLPEGEVVAIDRVRTGDASRQTYLRFRSAAPLALSGDGARGTLGASAVAIHAVTLSGGSPKVNAIGEDDCWSSSNYGVCKGARSPVTEYAVTQPGPQAFAIHVIDALGAGEAAATATALGDAGVLGAVVDRGAQRSIVLSSRTEASGAPATLTYTAPGDKGARHVVFDAPEDANGHATVTATVSQGKCVVTVSPGGSMTGRPLVVTVGAASSGCTVQEDAAAPGGSSGGSSSGGSSGGGSSSGGSSGGAAGGGSSSGGTGDQGGTTTSGDGTSGADPGTGGASDSGSGGSGGGCASAPSSGDTSGLAMVGVVAATCVRRRRRGTWFAATMKRCVSSLRRSRR